MYTNCAGWTTRLARSARQLYCDLGNIVWQAKGTNRVYFGGNLQELPRRNTCAILVKDAHARTCGTVPFLPPGHEARGAGHERLGDQAMATTSSSWRVESNGGLIYICEECCKSFNRLASYKAHIRTHAGNEQDGLDLVSKKIRQETSSSVECRETRCKTRRAAGERAEGPHRMQSQVSAVADVRQVADRQSSAVSSNGDVGSSLLSSGQG